MAMVMDNQQQQVTVAQMQPPPSPPQPEAYKHYCRVCKKGFMCGRALGGHMRAHDISDDGLGANVDSLDDDSALYGGEGDPWDVGSPTAGTKSMYALRANLNRLKSCRVCENCGKEFVSWKLFLEHGKCSSDEEDDVDGSLHSPRPYEVDGEEDAALVAGWSKGRRSRRSKVMVLGSVPLSASPLHCSSSEEEDLANCLVMLSASRVEQVSIVETDQESCASASKEEARRPPMPQPISFMAPAPQRTKVVAAVVPQNVSATPRGMFECKACKKVFPSHQALGGHRASHKKVKGCFAAKLESNLHEPLLQMPTAPGDIAKAAPNVNANVGADAKTDANANADSKMDVDTTEAAAATAALAMAIVPFHDQSAALTISPFKKKAKLHECSICHRVFTSGQALGGHKRCHWLTSSTADPNGPMTKIQSQAQEQADAIFHQLTLRSMLADAPEPTLDLNIPANPSPDIAAARRAELGGSPLRLDVPALVYHQSWPAAHSNASHRNKAATSSHNDVGGSAAEDESDSTSVKRAKLSDLKDMNMVGESSPWLQVGIGSSSGSDEKGTQE